MPSAAFSLQHSGFIEFSSDAPGENVKMHGPDGKALTFRPDASFFHDEGRRYVWVFEYPGQIAERMKFVFSTADREVVGEVRGATVHVFGHVDSVSPPITPAVTPTSRRTPIDPIVQLPRMTPSSFTGLPKVSIVTCTYNRPGFLREAVESLRAQTDGDWEHLIFDDGSTDPALDAVLDWAAEDPRVRIWRGRDNHDRPAMAWNWLLDRAYGQFFSVLDDDNTKLPEFVERMSAVLGAPGGPNLVTCGWVVLARDTEPDAAYYLNLTTNPEELERQSTCDGGAMLYSREAFSAAGYFSEAIRTNEDWDWLRRAVSVCAYKNLPVCLSTYRNHGTNRMLRADDLGHGIDSRRVQLREIQSTLRVRLLRPPGDRLTRSQEDATRGITHALDSIPWVSQGAESVRQAGDLAIVVTPFQLRDGEIEGHVRGAAKALSIHMEDPYALGPNLDRVRAMLRACPDTWVATNEWAAVPAYRTLVGPRVIVCPSLGADTAIGVPPPLTVRDIDVLLCGYAYPSRKAFVERLLPALTGLRVVLCGDGWDGWPAETMRTQDAGATYRLHARARAVVALHRIHGDCSDGPMEPTTVNRGYMEGFCGARVFLDRSRTRHAFDPGDVVWYSGAEELAGALRLFLTTDRDRHAADRFQAKCRAIYTCRARIARILNCVRAPRFLAEIP